LPCKKVVKMEQSAFALCREHTMTATGYSPHDTDPPLDMPARECYGSCSRSRRNHTVPPTEQLLSRYHSRSLDERRLMLMLVQLNDQSVALGNA
jgi:hypothetical protein